MNSKLTCFSLSSNNKCRGPANNNGVTAGYPKINCQNMNQIFNEPRRATGIHNGQTFNGSCNGNGNSASHHFIVLKGLSHIVVTCRCVVRRIYFAIPWPW